MTGRSLPTPREISNVCSNAVDNATEPVVNALFTTFAQFIDHDLTSTANGKDDDGHPITCQCREDLPNPFCMNIPTPDMPDQACMLFPRSSDFYQREIACDLSRSSCWQFSITVAFHRPFLAVREQVNQINSYLDASMIYGSAKDKSDHLRSFEKGNCEDTVSLRIFKMENFFRNRIGQLKTTATTLPPQAHAEKEGGACVGAREGRGCFVCGKRNLGR